MWLGIWMCLAHTWCLFKPTGLCLLPGGRVSSLASTSLSICFQRKHSKSPISLLHTAKEKVSKWDERASISSGWNGLGTQRSYWDNQGVCKCFSFPVQCWGEIWGLAPTRQLYWISYTPTQPWHFLNGILALVETCASESASGDTLTVQGWDAGLRPRSYHFRGRHSDFPEHAKTRLPSISWCTGCEVSKWRFPTGWRQQQPPVCFH